MADTPEFIYPAQTLDNSDEEEAADQNSKTNADNEDGTEDYRTRADEISNQSEPEEANGVANGISASDNDDDNDNGNVNGDGDGHDENDNDNEEDNNNDPSSDNESDLSEVDEAQFEDFDPTAIAIEDRPQIALDETNVGLLGQHKRKRTEAEIERDEKKKKKKKRRDRQVRRDGGGADDDDDDDFVGGEEMEGKRRRRRAGDGGERRDRDRERARARQKTLENEDDLTPEERRRRALDRAMDEALKNPSKRRRKVGGIDLDAMADAEIEDMRRRMTEAAQADNDARSRGRVAKHKVRMLADVVALLNRNTLQSSLVDPDINLLEAVRFFLEPLSDGSLPAYNIQRELFAALARLPVAKDALVASGIGKVTLFYTKSARPEPGIKRTAEKLLGEWTRPILKRSDDYRKREFVEREYDPTALPIRSTQSQSQSHSLSQSQRILHPTNGSYINSTGISSTGTVPGPADTPNLSNRARVDNSGPMSYTVVPRSNVVAGAAGMGMGMGMGRAPGKGGGGEVWKRIKSRGVEGAGAGAGQRR